MEVQANYIKRIEIHELWHRYDIAWDLRRRQYTFRHQRSGEDHYPEPFGQLSGTDIG